MNKKAMAIPIIIAVSLIALVVILLLVGLVGGQTYVDDGGVERNYCDVTCNIWVTNPTFKDAEFYKYKTPECYNTVTGSLSTLSVYDAGTLKMQIDSSIISKEWKEWESGESVYSLTARKVKQGSKSVKFRLEDMQGNLLDIKTQGHYVSC